LPNVIKRPLWPFSRKRNAELRAVLNGRPLMLCDRCTSSGYALCPDDLGTAMNDNERYIFTLANKVKAGL
jgi:hypothetical protein